MIKIIQKLTDEQCLRSRLTKKRIHITQRGDADLPIRPS